MKNITQPILPLLCVATLVAQQPATPAQPTAAPAVELVSLQALVGDTIHRRQATAATANGVSNDTPFARLCDAEFDTTGKLVVFVVEPPPTAGATTREQRRLPARDVQWDPATRRWLVVVPTLQWQELAPHDAAPAVGQPTGDDTKPAVATAAPPLRASVLVLAEPAAAAGAAKASDASSRRTPPRIVHWFAPGPQQIAMVSWPIAERHVLVPWSLLRVGGSAKSPTLQPNAAVNLDTAPECGSDETPPAAALRQRCYAHFGVEPPTWDRAHAEAGTPKAKGKDGSEARR